MNIRKPPIEPDFLTDNKGIPLHRHNVEHVTNELNRNMITNVSWKMEDVSLNVNISGGLLTVYGLFYKPDGRKNLHEWSGDLSFIFAGKPVLTRRIVGANLRELKHNVEAHLRAITDVICKAIIDGLANSPGFNTYFSDNILFSDGQTLRQMNAMERHRLRWGDMW